MLLRAFNTVMSSTAQPTPEQVEDVLLSCRYGELEELEVFAGEFGWEAVNSARDERGNTALHMACGNGHLGELMSLQNVSNQDSRFENPIAEYSNSTDRNQQPSGYPSPPLGYFQQPY